MSLINRLLNFNLDSYIVFSENPSFIKTESCVRANDLWADKYQLVRVDISEAGQRMKLAALWHTAFSQCASMKKSPYIPI